MSQPSIQLEMARATGLEREFLDALPEGFRFGAFVAYWDWKNKQAFNSIVEASKAKMAYMDAFVTAVFMVQKEGQCHTETQKPSEGASESESDKGA